MRPRPRRRDDRAARRRRRRAGAGGARGASACSARRCGVADIHVLATAAARDAANGADFLRRGRALRLRRSSCSRARARPSSRRSASSPASVSRTASSATSAAAAWSWSTSHGDDVGRGHHAAARRPCAAGPVRELAEEGAPRSCARGSSAPSRCEACKGRTFYAVGGTWRALARLHRPTAAIRCTSCTATRSIPRSGLRFLELVEEAEATSLKEIEAVSEARRPLLAYGAIVLEEIIRAGRRPRSSSRRSACARASSTSC